MMYTVKQLPLHQITPPIIASTRVEQLPLHQLPGVLVANPVLLARSDWIESRVSWHHDAKASEPNSKAQPAVFRKVSKRVRICA